MQVAIYAAQQRIDLHRQDQGQQISLILGQIKLFANPLPLAVLRNLAVCQFDLLYQIACRWIFLIEGRFLRRNLRWIGGDAVNFSMRNGQSLRRSGLLCCPKRPHPQDSALGPQSYPRDKGWFCRLCRFAPRLCIVHRQSVRGLGRFLH